MYTTENMSELYVINELPEGTFLLLFNIIDRYQQEYPVLLEKLNYAEYKQGSFRGGRNTITMVTYQDKIVTP